MKIYDQERQDGLEELLLARGSLSFDTKLKPKYNISKASIKNESQDIYEVESVLVSVGWNNNDDVFDPIQLWRARATPVNKRFNFMHNEKDIIGHITKANVLDIDGNIIPDNTEEDNLPDFFEISVASILYTFWEDEELQERANTIATEIPEGKWFVSMEVLFPDFDYAFTKGSEQKIIERGSETSFLTKYLRIYGGSGEYQDWKIGRKLNNMFFSGKGLVDKPANNRSLITAFNFNGAKASTSIFEEVNMSVDQKDYDKAVADLSVTKKDLEGSAKENEMLKDQVNNLKNDLESSKAFSQELKDSVKDLEEQLKKRDEKINEVNKALAEMVQSFKSQKRISQLVENGLESSKAQEVVNKFASASDEMFDEIIELHKSKSSVDSATNEVNSASASDDDSAPPQESDAQDESEQLLEQAKAFISNTLKNNKGDK